MNNIRSKLNSGFTLPEMLISMLIASGITISMFFMFLKVNSSIEHDMEKAYVLHSANLILNEMILEMSKTKDIIEYNGNSFQRGVVKTSNCRMALSYNSGLTIDYKKEVSKARDKIHAFISNSFSEDGQLKKYFITDFDVTTPRQVKGLEGTIGDAVNVREGSRVIFMEISLFDVTMHGLPQGQPHETVILERRVFSPGNFMYNEKLGESNEI